VQVWRPCAVEEEKIGEVRWVLAYAKAEAIRSAEDKDDEDGYQYTSNDANWRMVAAADGVAPQGHNAGTLAEKSGRP